MPTTDSRRTAPAALLLLSLLVGGCQTAASDAPPAAGEAAPHAGPAPYEQAISRERPLPLDPNTLRDEPLFEMGHIDRPGHKEAC